MDPAAMHAFAMANAGVPPPGLPAPLSSAQPPGPPPQ
jgi:hypothetical protein